MKGDLEKGRIAANEARITRARGQAEEGVKHIAKLMADGTWETGASHEAVAATFGVSTRTVEGWAIQASRTLRLALGEGEELRTRIALQLERHERIALKRIGVTMKGDEYPDPDVKAATGALKTMAEVMGLVTKKHEHAHIVAQYEQLPREGKSQWLRERAAQLVAEADRLDDVVPSLPP